MDSMPNGVIPVFIRRLNNKGQLYIRFVQSDLTSQSLKHMDRVIIDINNAETICGLVKTTGATPWLAPDGKYSNAEITRILKAAGLKDKDDLRGSWRLSS